jgi:hypothetical protein
MPPQVSAAPEVSLAEFQAARKIVSSFAYHTLLLTSRLLGEQTGYDVRAANCRINNGSLTVTDGRARYTKSIRTKSGSRRT